MKAPLALQAAHITALKADSVLSTLVSGRVYDYVPGNTPYPYVVYQQIEAVEWDACNFDGSEILIYVHTWSSYEGSKEVRGINDEVFRLLHNVIYPLTSGVLVNCRRTSLTVEREGQLYHSILMLRATTQET